MDVTALTTYLIAITVLTITPGVDTMLVIRNTARGGWRDGGGHPRRQAGSRHAADPDADDFATDGAPAPTAVNRIDDLM